MKMKRFLAGGVALLMSALLFTPGLNSAAAAEQPVNQMTPYDTYVEPDTFFNGASAGSEKRGRRPRLDYPGTGKHEVRVQHQYPERVRTRGV